jgi:putative endonuclease
VPKSPPPLSRIRDLIDACRLKLNRQSTTGDRGEYVAAQMLKKKNYHLVARNLRNRFGEIDIVALAPDQKTVVIVEVKSAEAVNTLPELRVDKKKQHRLTALAAQVVRRYKLQNCPIRFDIVAVNLPPDAEPVIRHHVAAFESHI